ncbi:GtrA family protein [Neobacillus sp. Marseille-QA0830]
MRQGYPTNCQRSLETVGACVSFFLNKNFTFNSKNPAPTSALCDNGLYFISYDVGKNMVVWALKNNHSLPSNIKTDLSVLIGTGLYKLLNYLGQKIFVFSKRQSVNLKNY